MASSGNGKWLYSDDCFPFVVTHVALAFTSLPRMLASNTFALNEMRNQNAISESNRHLTCGWKDISRLPIEDDRHVHSGA
ncbi:hypothetical protein T06_15400 [Trichinella sp. T6]|nr:hypothetical protein T06_15400 [Trichinella sp. T6]